MSVLVFAAERPGVLVRQRWCHVSNYIFSERGVSAGADVPLCLVPDPLTFFTTGLSHDALPRGLGGYVPVVTVT